MEELKNETVVTDVEETEVIEVNELHFTGRRYLLSNQQKSDARIIWCH